MARGSPLDIESTSLSRDALMEALSRGFNQSWFIEFSGAPLEVASLAR